VKTRRRSSPRGSALILAILIMLAMLGLGLMAMRTTTHAMAGTGNLRLGRQARAVAETGLYHIATLMSRGGAPYLGLREGLRASAGDVVRIRFNSDGTVQYYRGRADAPEALGPQAGTTAPVPPFLAPDANRPAPLGQFGTNAGLVPSYFVELDGFTAMEPKNASCSDPNPANCPKDCLIEFTSTAFLARVPLPAGAEFDGPNASDQFAQQTVKAVLKVPTANSSLCQ
jgi:hypothetical protein